MKIYSPRVGSWSAAANLVPAICRTELVWANGHIRIWKIPSYLAYLPDLNKKAFSFELSRKIIRLNANARVFTNTTKAEVRKEPVTRGPGASGISSFAYHPPK